LHLLRKIPVEWAARSGMVSRGSDDKLEAELQPAVDFFEDFLEIL
jgi:hypothetical protein